MNPTPSTSIIVEQSCEFCGEFFPLRAERNCHKCPFFNSLFSETKTVDCEPNENPGDKEKSTEPALKKFKPSNFKVSVTSGHLDLKPAYRCERCPTAVSKQEFSSLHELNLHYAKFHPVNQRESSKPSGNEVNNVKQLQTKPVVDQLFQCVNCDLYFEDSEKCRRHIIDAHLPQTDRNNKMTLSELRKVMKNELRDADSLDDDSDCVVPTQHSCSECGECFDDKTALCEHALVTHGKNTLYECSVCGKIFSQRLLLTRHMQTHKETIEAGVFVPKNVFECEFCRKQFAYESYYKRHLATHVGASVFTCDICGQDLRSQSRLVLHRAGHLGHERFRCHKCNKHFAYKSMLDRHERTHVGDLQACEYCDKKFAIQSMLDKHVSIMHMEAQQHLACPHCNKRFLYPSYLERHLTTHSGDRQHACPMCSRTFVQRGTLLTHLQSHLPSFLETQKPYNCPVNFCDQSYKREITLLKHLENAHCIDRTVASILMSTSHFDEAETVISSDKNVADNKKSRTSSVTDGDQVSKSCPVFVQNDNGVYKNVSYQRVRADDGKDYFAIPVTIIKDSHD